MQSYRKRETLDPKVERISMDLAKDIIQYLSLGVEYAEKPDIYAETMRRLGMLDCPLLNTNVFIILPSLCHFYRF